MITIGWSKAKAWYKFGSEIIAESEKRNYSHAYITYICPITKETMVAQAAHGSVNEINYTEFLKKNIVVKQKSIELTEQEFITALTFIKKHQGMPYSTLQILLLSVKKLFKTQIKYNNEDTQFICSELVIRVLRCFNPKLADGVNLDYVTPSDLEKIVDNEYP